MGIRLYPKASELLVMADGGGSNGGRVRLWKIELQKLAEELNMTIHVCHFPPSTSKMSFNQILGSVLKQTWEIAYLRFLEAPAVNNAKEDARSPAETGSFSRLSS
jgi:hypothetical protein